MREACQPLPLKLLAPPLLKKYSARVLAAGSTHRGLPKVASGKPCFASLARHTMQGIPCLEAFFRLYDLLALKTMS